MKLLHLAVAILVLSSGAHAQGNGPPVPGKQKAPTESAKPYAPGQKKQPGESAKQYSPGHSKDTKNKKSQSNNLDDDKRYKERNTKP